MNDPKLVSDLISALHDSNKSVRAYAARTIAELEDPTTVDALFMALKDPYDEVRYIAAVTLGRIGQSKTVEIRQLLTDQDPGVRWAATIAIGELKDSDSMKMLSHVLVDVEWEVRLEAARALGKLGNKQAGPILITALEDTHTNVCAKAAEALGKLGVAEALPALEQMRLEDKRRTPGGMRLSKFATRAIEDIKKQMRN